MNALEPSAWIASALIVIPDITARSRATAAGWRLDDAAGEFGRILRPGDPRPGHDQLRRPRRTPLAIGQRDRAGRQPRHHLEDLGPLDGRRRTLALQRVFVGVDRSRPVVEQHEQKVGLRDLGVRGADERGPEEARTERATRQGWQR